MANLKKSIRKVTTKKAFKDYGNAPAFSKASKMPCRSWSLPALDTCPASKEWNEDAKKMVLVDACGGCYATTGNYIRFPNVKNPRIHNKKDWKRANWVADMVESINLNDKYFRWFDSGDMYELRLAKKILEVMKLTPATEHWLPTRQHKYPKFHPTIDAMNALPNVIVRLSSDSIMGGIIAGNYTSTIIPDPTYTTPEMTLCKAYENKAKCGACRKCWDKYIKVIAYPSHGEKMDRLYKKKNLENFIPTLEVA